MKSSKLDIEDDYAVKLELESSFQSHNGVQSLERNVEEDFDVKVRSQ